ncbi:MAG: sugar ABC transporter ATP-binding protein [Rhodospirillaceae bacterium]|nr:sugar ABC transporter ATP-binding protein [Rhodospirillaceae bacterium]|tara:strand:+ start:981 stop:1730 length:750 start_codon:yes stop_codon:yes gene_type:complete
MAHVKLTNINVEIPIYDANALRLFKRRATKDKSKVGSGSFSTAGVLSVQALRNVNLEVNDGERLALIGHNGAGKTTLLRFIAGVYPKGEGIRDILGDVHLYGSASSINPDGTGYENILLAMRLNGLDKSLEPKIRKDVEEFTELGEFLNMPMRTYSAGMSARLNFAIATLKTPSILLIDEGIGAGDKNFADKVEKRVKEFTDRAKIIVMASHSGDFLKKMCNRGAVLRRGSIEFFGDVEKALEFYDKSL